MEPIESFLHPRFICVSLSLSLFFFLSFLLFIPLLSLAIIGSVHDATFFNFTLSVRLPTSKNIVSIPANTKHTHGVWVSWWSDERIMRIHSGGSFTRYGYKAIGMGQQVFSVCVFSIFPYLYLTLNSHFHSFVWAVCLSSSAFIPADRHHGI